MKSHCKQSFRMRAVERWMRAIAPLMSLSTLMGGAERAAAYPVTFEFAGVVTGLNDPNSIFGGAVSVGDAFSGSYTFESTTPDTNDDPRFGRYTDAITDIAGDISGIDFFGPVDTSPDNASNLISVGDDRGQLADGYGVASGIEFLGHAFRFQLSFVFDPSTVLEDDSLLLDPPPFEFVTDAGLRLISEIPGAILNLSGDIQVFVPEPTSMVLLAIGAIALLRRPRRTGS